MNNKNNFYKIIIIFLMTGISMHIFVIEPKIIEIAHSETINIIYKFYLSLWVSMKEFDIIWIIFFIFIYYFFYKNYHIDNKWTKIKTISSIISAIISIIILVLISIHNYHNLTMLYKSSIQIYKCIIISIGYYLIIYIIIRNILTRFNYEK